MDTIEFEEPEYSECSCCGAKMTRLTRFVSRDDCAFSVYFANFSDGQKHQNVHVLAGFGNWDDDATPEQRTAFAFKLWPREADFVTTIVDAEEGQWDTKILGRILSREKALDHEWLKEVYDLSDHIVRCDQPIKDFLESIETSNK